VRPGSHGYTLDGHRYDDTLPIANAANFGTSWDPIRIAIVLRPGTDPQTARDRLAAFPGITTESPAAYPGPLAALLRAWTRQHQHEDIAASLTALEEAIRRDREYQRRRN
jgi:hypothetical protein